MRRRSAIQSQSQRRGGISQQVDLILSQSVRGGDDPQKQAEVWQRARALKSEAARFVREYPEMTNEAAVAWVQGDLGRDVELSAAQRRGGR